MFLLIALCVLSQERFAMDSMKQKLSNNVTDRLSKLFGLGVIFLIVITLTSACKDKAAAGGPPMMAMPIEASVPKIQTVYKKLKATGTLYPQQQITVTSEIAGRIVQLPFKEGQFLHQNDLLIYLDDTVLQAELKKAKAAINLSQLKYERAKSLLGKGSGAQSEVDQALSELKINEANVAFADAQLKKTQIRAPFSGYVGITKIDSGEYITPGQVIAQLSDLSTLKLDFRLPEIYYQVLKTGQTVEIEVDTSTSEKFRGKVVSIDPQIDVDGRSVYLQAVIDNPNFVLRPGLFANVELIIETHENALLVPEQAIQYDNMAVENNAFVFVVKKNKDKNEEAVMQPVSTGVHEKGLVEITKGVKKDDLVITSGHVRLFPNAPVRIIK